VKRLHGRDPAPLPRQKVTHGAALGPARVRIAELAAKNSRKRRPALSPALAISAGTAWRTSPAGSGDLALVDDCRELGGHS
jgi:hypothetical protein